MSGCTRIHVHIHIGINGDSHRQDQKGRILKGMRALLRARSLQVHVQARLYARTHAPTHPHTHTLLRRAVEDAGGWWAWVYRSVYLFGQRSRRIFCAVHPGCRCGHHLGAQVAVLSPVLASSRPRAPSHEGRLRSWCRALDMARHAVCSGRILMECVNARRVCTGAAMP